MSNVIRSLVIKTGVDLTQAQAGLKQLGKDLKTAGKNFTTVGTSLTKSITVPVMVGVAALGSLVGKTIAVADRLQNMSDVTGITTTRLQELAVIGERVDVDLETIAGSQQKLIRAMKQAKDGTKAQVDAFKELGISVVDSDGNLRDSNVVMGEVLTALNAMTNPTERDATALKLMGRSALELNPLIKTSAGDIAALADEAHAMGAVLSEESVEAMDDFGDRLGATGVAISAGASNITLALLPALNKLLDAVVTKGLPALQSFTNKIKWLIDGFTGMPTILQEWTGLLVGTAVLMGPALLALGKLTIAYRAVVVNVVAMNTAIAGGQGTMAALTALAGGPAGMAIVALGVIALTVGAAVIAYKELNKAALALNDALTPIAAEADRSAKAYAEQNAEMETNTILAARLTAELFTLNDKEKKSNLEKSRMATLMAQLNEMYPDLNLAINTETGLLNKNRSAVVTLVKEKEKSLKFAAYEARMIELLKESIKLEGLKADALTVVTDKYGPMTDAQIRDSVAAGHAYGGTIPELIQAYMDIATVLDTNNAAYATTATAHDQMVTDIVAGTDTLVADTAEADAETIAAQEAAAAAYQAYRDELEGTTQEYMDTMGDFYADGITMNETSAAQIQENLRKQTQQFTTWLGEIKKIGQKIPPALLQELIDMGPEATGAIQDLNNMTAGELAAWVKTWQDNATAAYDATLYEMSLMPGTVTNAIDGMNQELKNTNPLYQSGIQMGESIMNGLTGGIANKLPRVISTSRNAAEEAMRQMRLGIQYGSPSKITTQYGRAISDGLTVGIKARAMEAISQAKNLASNVMGAFRNMGSFAGPQLAYAAAAPAPQSSSARSESNAASMYQAVSKAFQDNSARPRIELVTMINGREIARGIAPDIDIELEKIKTNKSRGG